MPLMIRSALLALLLLPAATCFASPLCERQRSPVSQWVADLVSRSEDIFFGTVTLVSPPLPDSGERLDIWTVAVHESYKGDFPGGPLKPADTGFGLVPGESSVFFIDAEGRILPCSSYQHYLTDFGAINEVRQALKGGI